MRCMTAPDQEQSAGRVVHHGTYARDERKVWYAALLRAALRGTHARQATQPVPAAAAHHSMQSDHCAALDDCSPSQDGIAR
jgi:hypothetical protein